MLIKKLLVISAAALFSFNVFAAENCFIAKENGRIIKQIGQCDKRLSPCSSFKVPIALMGFDAGILKSPTQPKLKFTEAIRLSNAPNYNPAKYPFQKFWMRDQTPESWMKYSVVWYSQEVTKKLGMEKFKNYLDKFDYGNKDVSGTPGKNDGLTESWLENSLKISSREQVEFIEKLGNRKLPVSKQAIENTVKIIALENVGDDWKLYGKTGSGAQIGRFVGWVEKGNRRIFFAQDVVEEAFFHAGLAGGKIAKELAKDNLVGLF